MSGYSVVLDGAALTATIVGGGAVAARKATALARAGARVRVVAPAIRPELRALVAESDGRVSLVERAYEAHDLDGARLAMAATDDPALNARIAAEARARGILVNVADAPELGDFVTPAVHSAGDVLVAVSAGGVPAAAARVRDAIARRVDGRYAEAVAALGALRRELLARGERERWRELSAEIVDDEFCARVERGELAEWLARWAS